MPHTDEHLPQQAASRSQTEAESPHNVFVLAHGAPRYLGPPIGWHNRQATCGAFYYKWCGRGVDQPQADSSEVRYITGRQWHFVVKARCHARPVARFNGTSRELCMAF